MQTVNLVYPRSSNNFLDVMTYVSYADEPESDLYALGLRTRDKKDFAIYSIHESVYDLSDFKTSIAVISYIPDINSKEWPQFYLNLCLAPICACDSWVKKRLDNITFPYKAWINLDGINPPCRNLAISKSDPTSIHISCLDQSPFTEYLAAFLTDKRETDKNRLNLKYTKDLNCAEIFFSINPMGQLISNTLAASNRQVWLAYDELSSLFLDSRHTHNYSAKIERLGAYAGGARSGMFYELVEPFVDELSNLASHLAVSKPRNFTSSDTLVSRIMTALNRAR